MTSKTCAIPAPSSFPRKRESTATMDPAFAGMTGRLRFFHEHETERNRSRLLRNRIIQQLQQLTRLAVEAFGRIRIKAVFPHTGV